MQEKFLTKGQMKIASSTKNSLQLLVNTFNSLEIPGLKLSDQLTNDKTYDANFELRTNSFTENVFKDLVEFIQNRIKETNRKSLISLINTEWYIKFNYIEEERDRDYKLEGVIKFNHCKKESLNDTKYTHESHKQVNETIDIMKIDNNVTMLDVMNLKTPDDQLQFMKEKEFVMINDKVAYILYRLQTENSNIELLPPETDKFHIAVTNKRAGLPLCELYIDKNNDLNVKDENGIVKAYNKFTLALKDFVDIAYNLMLEKSIY